MFKTKGAFSLIQAFKLFIFVFPSFVSAHDCHDHSCQIHQSFNEDEADSALQLFEKAYRLSPDLLPETNPDYGALIPYYKFKGEKTFLTQSSMVLMREWIHIFADEIEKRCEDCHIDREALLKKAVENELLAQETANYTPENKLARAVSDQIKHNAEDLSHLTAHYTAKYGKVIAGLYGIVEALETVVSFMTGFKGVHLICAPLQILIFPAGRKIQKYGRTLFNHGFHLSNTSLLLTGKMAWTTRKLHRRARNTFFYIDQALEFNEEELEKFNQEGPKSLYYKKGHRLLWLERLKKKTDPLFAKINDLETELEHTNLTERRKRKRIEKQIQSARNKIENLTKINRKEFFGNRFKRYLFLKSRKGRRAYMDGPDLKAFNFIHKTIGSNSLSWPLAPEFLIEKIKEPNRNHTLLGDLDFPLHKNSDEVISGLIEEFLSEKKISDPSGESRKAVHFFISDFHNIFDTTQKSSSRVMSAEAIEILLTQFFAHYLKLAEKRIPNLNSMSYRTKLRVYSRIGKIQNLAMQFTDFLMAVSFAGDPNKINFYKYESIEKFFAFLSYFEQIGQIINQDLTAQETLYQIEQAQNKIESFSLTREKNSKINLIPFTKRKGKCYEITRKYQ